MRRAAASSLKLRRSLARSTLAGHSGGEGGQWRPTAASSVVGRRSEADGACVRTIQEHTDWVGSSRCCQASRRQRRTTARRSADARRLRETSLGQLRAGLPDDGTLRDRLPRSKASSAVPRRWHARPHLQGHANIGGNTRRPARHQRPAIRREGVERRHQEPGEHLSGTPKRWQWRRPTASASAAGIQERPRVLDGTLENTFSCTSWRDASAARNQHALRLVDHTVKLFDVNDGTLRTFRHHTSAVFCLALMPDGLRFVYGSWDGDSRIAYHGLAPLPV